TMIGLGVGIDYALFLVSRHRTQRREGLPLEESVAMAVATTGTAIVFAGSTVVIALITLVVAGIPLVTSLGYAAAVAVVTAVLAAITLLPAVLAVVGKRLESLRVPAFLRPKPKAPDRGFWGWWARQVTEHPWLAVAGAAAILAPLIVPFFSLDLGQEDIGATPKSTTERQAYDLMAAGFGAGYNGPLLVATELGSPAQPSSSFESEKKQAQELQQQLEQEQTQGKSQQQQLTEQANELNRKQDQLEQQQTALVRQQGTLESEQAALERQASELSNEQLELQATRDRLQERQATLTTQLKALGVEAKELVREGAKLAKTGSTVVRRLARTRAEERSVEARLARNPRRPERARLEAKLRSLQRREDGLERELDRVIQQEQALRSQSQALVARSEALRAEEADLADQAGALGAQAVALAKQAAEVVQQKQTLVQEAADLQVQAANLQTQAADLQTQAANLQTEKVGLQGQQQQAQSQQQQAEQLQTELTNELTKAGGDERGTDPRLVKLQDGLTDTLGVKIVSPPRINKAGDAAIFTVIATTAPAATETADLVRTLRSYTIPQATSGTNMDAFVGGQTASYVDLASGISSRLALVILVVIALSFIVLLTAFRSFVFAAQAAVANILSVAAAFGVLTAVFQWGWGLSLVGLDTASGTDPIASYVPLMMFAVLFGLSMDYQVFLISQIEHQRAVHVPTREAVAGGLATGARVITAAALIMMSVFGSFVLNDDPTVKQFGVGLSVGVALAAMTVLLLAPALLVLAGAGSWWMPGWLDRILPHVDVEGAAVRRAPAAVEAPPAAAEP
ncbi:MAG TPA: MMPL family transporter, partial [Gaiellaceae bacterium]|nr:MMPL family transporter [Gaiellaceae bacterium]